jgi:hypothetical protein
LLTANCSQLSRVENVFIPSEEIFKIFLPRQGEQVLKRERYVLGNRCSGTGVTKKTPPPRVLALAPTLPCRRCLPSRSVFAPGRSEDILGEDGLLKQLIKRWWSKPWKPKWPNTWATSRMTVLPATQAIPATAKEKTLKGDFSELPIEVPRVSHREVAERHSAL